MRFIDSLIIVVLLLVAVACSARTTLPVLPPNGSNLAYKQDADFGSVLLLQSGALSQPIAQWQVADYFVVKVAHSPTWHLTMVALPFNGQQWNLHQSETVE